MTTNHRIHVHYDGDEPINGTQVLLHDSGTLSVDLPGGDVVLFGPPAWLAGLLEHAATLARAAIDPLTVATAEPDPAGELVALRLTPELQHGLRSQDPGERSQARNTLAYMAAQSVPRSAA